MRKKYLLINEILSIDPNYTNLEKYTFTELKIIKLAIKYMIPRIYHEQILKLKNEMLIDEIAIKVENMKNHC